METAAVPTHCTIKNWKEGVTAKIDDKLSLKLCTICRLERFTKTKKKIKK